MLYRQLFNALQPVLQEIWICRQMVTTDYVPIIHNNIQVPNAFNTLKNA
jgi:hypothetical protein